MAVSGVACGPGGVNGVTYAQINGQQITCGVDSSGSTLYLQVSTLAGDQAVPGGEVVGFQLGGAMLSVMAAAWCVRVLRSQFSSGAEG